MLSNIYHKQVQLHCSSEAVPAPGLFVDMVCLGNESRTICSKPCGMLWLLLAQGVPVVRL